MEEKNIEEFPEWEESKILRIQKNSPATYHNSMITFIQKKPSNFYGLKPHMRSRRPHSNVKMEQWFAKTKSANVNRSGNSKSRRFHSYSTYYQTSLLR
jgi:hypothetical protein